MTYIFRLRYLLSLILALILIFLLATPVGDPTVALKVFGREIRPKTNHRAVNNAIICNVTDETSAAYGLIGTKLPSSIVFRVNSSSAPSSIRSNLTTIVSNSFNDWETTTGVDFVRESNTSKSRARRDGQNIVAWDRLSRSTLGATYIWYNTSTGAVVEVDTIMNSRHPWSWTNPNTVDVDQNCPSTNAYDAQNILVHEIGHWVGLEDLYGSNEEDLTMYGFGSKQELKKDTLESGDEAGASTIYP